MLTNTISPSEFSEPGAVTGANHYLVTDDATMSLAIFIEKRFIPNHVRIKSAAGKTHYQAILKHILKPETVQALFAQDPSNHRMRLKSVPGWPYLDNVRLFDLNADHVRQLTASAISRGYSVQTVKHIKNVLSTIIAHAKKERLFEGDNPAAEVKLPRLVHAIPKHLTIDEARAILRMLKHPEREIALIAMTTGVGVSEICALKWKHINLSRSMLCIEGVWVPPRGVVFQRNSTCVDEGEPSRERLKVVVVPESLIRMLERLKQRRENIDENGFILATPQGDPHSARAHRLKPIGRKLRIPWLSWLVLKRAHGAFLSELSIRLVDDLVHNAQEH
jgi:integrase